MGFSLSLGLAGSAIGLAIAFSALLGGGQENFFKNIAVALMPSTQGIYSIVVLFANMSGFEVDSYATAGKAAAFGFTMFFSAWYQGSNIIDILLDNLRKSFYFKGSLLNGNLLVYLILNTLWFHLPLILMIIVSGSLTSEYKDRTIQTIMLQPVSKWK